MGELYHHGILGQKWGIRRFQNPDGTLTAAGRLRFKSQQQAEYKVANKSQIKGYRSSYDRMKDYTEKSQVIKTRGQELTDLAKKVNDLHDKLLEFKEDDKVYDEAVKRATTLAKKNPEFDPKYDDLDDLVEWYLYEGNVLSETAYDLNKNNPTFKKMDSEYDSLVNEYKTKCKTITNEIIGDYGNQKVSGLGTDMTYRELVNYALAKQNAMPMFTYEEYMGRK